MVAVVIGGGVVAAAGQAAYSGSLPDVDEGVNALRVGLAALTSDSTALLGRDPEPSVTDVGGRTVRVPFAPVAVQPAIGATGTVSGADLVADVVKAADLHQAVADQARRTAEEAAAAKRAAEEAAARKAAEAARLGASLTASGGIKMLVGRITSGFGLRSGAQHQGIDIAAPIGTPIHVPLAGRVIDSGPASGFGLWVRVEHADGTITTYGHINRAFVSVGQQVSAGQRIAEVGNRGESTGPHLHFEVTTSGGTTINPKPWLDQRGIGYT